MATKYIPNINMPGNIDDTRADKNDKKKIKNPLPWWSDKCKESQRLREKSLKIYRNYQSTENRKNFKTLRNETNRLVQRLKGNN